MIKNSYSGAPRKPRTDYYDKEMDTWREPVSVYVARHLKYSFKRYCSTNIISQRDVIEDLLGGVFVKRGYKVAQALPASMQQAEEQSWS